MLAAGAEIGRFRAIWRQLIESNIHYVAVGLRRSKSDCHAVILGDGLQIRCARRAVIFGYARRRWRRQACTWGCDIWGNSRLPALRMT